MRKDLNEARRFLTDWQSPQIFRDLVSRHCIAIEPRYQFGHNASKWLNEAWILAQMSLAIPMSRLRLCELDPPDACFEVEGQEWPIELTVADWAGRKISEEYRTGKEFPAKFDDTDEDLIIMNLMTAAHKKESKSYPDNVSLCVYLNCGFHFGTNSRVEKRILELVKSKSKTFRSIFVLWGDRIYGPAAVIPHNRKVF